MQTFSELVCYIELLLFCSFFPPLFAKKHFLVDLIYNFSYVNKKDHLTCFDSKHELNLGSYHTLCNYLLISCYLVTFY